MALPLQHLGFANLMHSWAIDGGVIYTTPNSAAHHTVDTSNSLSSHAPSRRLFAGGTCCQASKKPAFTSLLQVFQARDVFFNRPLQLISLCLTYFRSLLQFSICSSSSLLALSPSKISLACKASLPSMRAVRSDSFIS